jgi:hypothetical protein
MRSLVTVLPGAAALGADGFAIWRSVIGCGSSWR